MQVIISTEQKAQFQKILSKLNKKAAKFGLQEITVGEPVTVDYVRVSCIDAFGDLSSKFRIRKDTDSHFEPSYQFLHIDVQGPLVKLGDWTTIAYIENIGDHNVVSVFNTEHNHDGKALQVAKEKIVCEHCNINRPRKHSFLLMDGDGTYKQVGTTCLKDHTGHDPAAALFLAKLHTVLKNELGDPFGGDSTSLQPVYNVKHVLAIAHYIVEKQGYVSRATADIKNVSATADDVGYVLSHGFTNADDEKLRNAYEQLLNKASISIEKFLQRAPENAFIMNTQNILSAEFVAAKHLGYVVAVIGAELADERKNEQQESASKSNYVGTVGEKITFVGKLVKITPYQNMYGTGYFVHFVDENGNRFVWATSTDMHDAKKQIDKAFKIACTIKKHDAFNGINQTYVIRAKLVEI